MSYELQPGDDLADDFPNTWIPPLAVVHLPQASPELSDAFNFALWPRTTNPQATIKRHLSSLAIEDIAAFSAQYDFHRLRGTQCQQLPSGKQLRGSDGLVLSLGQNSPHWDIPDAEWVDMHGNNVRVIREGSYVYEQAAKWTVAVSLIRDQVLVPKLRSDKSIPVDKALKDYGLRVAQTKQNVMTEYERLVDPASMPPEI